MCIFLRHIQNITTEDYIITDMCTRQKKNIKIALLKIVHFPDNNVDVGGVDHKFVLSDDHSFLLNKTEILKL